MVRSLVMKSNREYECVASDPSGPIITWSLYHKQTDSWENLDTSGDDYTIQSVNVSTCVVRSTLVMSSSQVNPTAVACTAQAGSNSATALIYNGKYQLWKQLLDTHALPWTISGHLGQAFIARQRPWFWNGRERTRRDPFIPLYITQWGSRPVVQCKE